MLTVDGWRLGMGICKDTGVAAHTEATSALDIDVYIAALVHLPEELDEQDARGLRIAAACDAYVAFASFAGPTGGGYSATAGQSTIWSPSGEVLARATPAVGESRWRFSNHAPRAETSLSRPMHRWLEAPRPVHLGLRGVADAHHGA